MNTDLFFFHLTSLSFTEIGLSYRCLNTLTFFIFFILSDDTIRQPSDVLSSPSSNLVKIHKRLMFSIGFIKIVLALCKDACWFFKPVDTTLELLQSYMRVNQKLMTRDSAQW